MEAGTAPSGEELEAGDRPSCSTRKPSTPPRIRRARAMNDPEVCEEAAKDAVAWWEKHAHDA